MHATAAQVPTVKVEQGIPNAQYANSMMEYRNMDNVGAKGMYLKGLRRNGDRMIQPGKYSAVIT